MIVILELVDKLNKAGRCPIKIIVRQHGKRSYITTGLRVLPSQWDSKIRQVRSSHPLHVDYNATINRKRNEVEQSLLSGIPARAGNMDIIAYFDRLLSELSLSPATIRVYKVELKRLTKYSGGRLMFGAVTESWMRSYVKYLRSELNENSVHKSWRVLRAVVNRARKDGFMKQYPFRERDNPRYRQTDRVYLTSHELKAFETALLLPLDQTVYISGKYFLLGCLTGLRISDWRRLNGSFVRDGRLILRAKKNGELVSMPMSDRLKRLIDELLTLPLPVDQVVNRSLKVIAKYAGINKPIHAHAARHTFAVRLAERGVGSDTTALLMGINLNAVAYYYKVTGVKVDAELSGVDL